MTLHSVFRALVATVLLAIWATSPAFAGQVLEADPTTLDETLERAGPGDVVRLAPGRYDILDISRGGSATAPLTVRAADAEARPTLGGLRVGGASHLVLDGLDFVLDDSEAGSRRSFRVEAGRDIRLTDLSFAGTRDATGPWGVALEVTGTTGFRLENSELRGFAEGVNIAGSTDVAVTGNDIHGMGADGIEATEVRDLRIEDNVLHDFDRDGAVAGNAAMISVRTRGTDVTSTGIVIRNNVLNSGAGPGTQSIFLGNDRPDTASSTLRNVTIEGNVILNAQADGIFVDMAEGLTIRRNTVLHNAYSRGAQQDDGVWTPRIRVGAQSDDVVILGNVAHALPEDGSNATWVVAGNYRLDDWIGGKSDQYAMLFDSPSHLDPAKLEHFAARPGGPLDGRDVGAPRLMALSRDSGGEGSPDSPAPVLHGRISFDVAARAILSEVDTGRPVLSREIGGSEILVGDRLDPVVLSPEMTAPLYDAQGFDMSMRLRPRAGYESAGEVLRLHRVMRVWVTGRGSIEVELLLDGGAATRLRSRPTRMNRGGSTDIRVSYEGPVGMLRIHANGELIGETHASGILSPRGEWGLSFGNPFGTKDSFEGAIEAFELKTTRATVLDGVTDTVFRR